MKSPYKICLTGLLLVSFFASKGQTEHTRIAQLQVELKNASVDTSRSRILYEIGDQYYNLSADSCLQYAKLAMSLAKKSGAKTMEAKATNLVGICMLNKSCLISALEHFNKSYQLFSALDDKTGEAKLLNNLGVIYSELGEYTSAIEKYKRSYNLNLELQNWSLASSALFNISINEFSDKQNRPCLAACQ
jgi:tetratricopeptide (TPR) repeat protein